jgi:putative transcriptional regulator
VDRIKIAATTPAEIAQQAQEDGSEADDVSAFEPTVLAQSVRRQLGMTQAEFAQALRIPLATLRNWEQGRVRPDPAARSLLLIVARNPDAALAALVA